MEDKPARVVTPRRGMAVLNWACCAPATMAGVGVRGFRATAGPQS